MTDHTIAAIIYEAMLWGNDQLKRPKGIDSYIPFGNSDAEIEARRFADRIAALPEYDRAALAAAKAGGAEMSKPPYNAGQTIEIEHVIHGPVTTVDLGKITVLENWGRLFIKQGSENEVVIERGAYVALRDAINHFIEQQTPPDPSIDEIAYRFWSIHPRDVPDPVGMPDRYPGGARAWFYATEIRKVLEKQRKAK